MYKKISGLVVSLTAVFACAAWAEVPAGYPADYQKTIDAAVKEGKVVIYSTTDTKAAGPLIKGFEAQYPGVKVEYNDMNSTELYNRYISEQAAGGGHALGGCFRARHDAGSGNASRERGGAAGRALPG